MPDATTPPVSEEKKKRKRRKKVERLFDIADAVYLQQSRVKHKLFTDYLPHFAAFDSALDAAFGTAWLAKIEQCEGLPPDYSVLAEQEGNKDELENLINIAIKKVGVIEYYANKAYEQEPDALYEFSFEKVQRPDQYSNQFIINCFTIRLLATGIHNPELAAVGLTPLMTTELETATENVAAYEISHEVSKRHRLYHTRQRIKQMNQLFALNESVKKAALVVFADKPNEAGLWR